MSTSKIPETPGTNRSQETAEAGSSANKTRLLRLLVVIILFAGGSLIWTVWLNPSARSQRELTAARAAQAEGDFETAERLAASALDRDPESVPAALLAADNAAAQNHFEQAIDYLNHVRSTQKNTLIHVALMKAEWSLNELHHISRSERAYREVLASDPDNIPANTGLAKLLGLCGRRREAIPHVLRLIRQDQDTDLLILISREGSVIDDREFLEVARTRAAADPLPLLGLAWHAASDEDYDRAIALLNQALQLDPELVPVHIALGRSLLQTRQFDRLVAWNQHLPSEAMEAAEAWVIRGSMAEHADDLPGAIRCYWEAAKISPELRIPTSRLAKLLVAAGRREEANRFAVHLQNLLEIRTAQDRMMGSANHDSIDPAIALAEACERGGRLWEAYAWCRIAAHADEKESRAREQFQRLRKRVRSLPLQITAAEYNIARSIDLSEYPIPKFTDLLEQVSPSHARAGRSITFRDDASAADLRFRYFNGTVGAPSRRMYEYTGGGIGVLDYDGDNWPDLYFTQGRPWTPGEPSQEDGDRLFRNRSGIRFEDVTASAGFQEDDFGQGLAVGDYNSDGFPDLFVGNIGRNRLWRNNGDGTFTDVTDESGITGSEWTTSCLFADLDGDGLADIYAVNYLLGEDVFERICRHPQGEPVACTPINFDGQPDRFWRNDGQGNFSDVTETLLSTPPNGKGLGVVAWDSDGGGRLSLLVANDTTPNMFFVPKIDESGKLQFTEQAILSGIAVNSVGKAEGCMGIALGDVDNDGRLDAYITNFLQESNTLYMASSGPLFEDRTHEFGLHQPTLNLLGFGTQFFDADLDGIQELFVANGHVDDLRKYGRPYQMRAQLFERAGNLFEEVPADRLGPYFQTEHLGRAAVKLDWNCDGREDLVVGHLDSDTALLTNTSPHSGAFFQLRLIGSTSNRDAVGTSVVIRAGNQSWTRQITAGESYQSSNQPQLTIGLGSVTQIDELQIRWPSGIQQLFSEVPLSRELVLVEGKELLQVQRDSVESR